MSAPPTEAEIEDARASMEADLGRLNDAQAAMTISDLYEAANDVEAAVIALARTNVGVFAEYVMKDSFTGKPLRLSPMHAEWHRLADEHKALILWASREAGKSVAMVVTRTLWELGRDPTLTFCVVSNTHDQAVSTIKPIKSYIENSEELHRVFPDMEPGDQWTGNRFTIKRPNTAKDPSVLGIGVHGAVLGARIRRLILDDILDVENTLTKDQRQKLWDWYFATLPGALKADAKRLVVGTAFVPDNRGDGDFMHRLAKMPGWVSRRFPILDENGESAWPEVWPVPRIEDRRVELGPLEFARQMMCVARDDTSARFRREWIEQCLRNGAGKEMAYGIQSVPPGCKVYTGVDLAVEDKADSDLTVLFTILVHPNGSKEVLCIESGKWQAPEILARIRDTHRRYMGIMIVESNACFPPGTMVLTIDGHKPIEAIKTGDLVMTHRGQWRPVREVTSAPFFGQLRVVKPAGGLAIRCTPTHAFWVRESGRVQGPRAGANVGKHRPVGQAGWHSALLLHNGDNGDAHYLCTPASRWPAVPAVLKVRRYRVTREVQVDENLGLVLGLYMAEGSIGTAPQVAFALHEREAHLRRFIADVMRRNFGAASFESKRQGRCIAIVVNSAEFKRVAALFGKRAEKRPPWEWMGWPLALRLAIVRGWLMGDGCLRWNNRKSKWPVQFLSGQSISRAWIAQARATMLEAGMRPAVYENDAHVSTIGGRRVAGRRSYSLMFNTDDTAAIMGSLAPVESTHWAAWNGRREGQRESNSQIVHDLGSVWSKVSALEQKPYMGTVHNLVVDEDHSYVVEDTAVHNSQKYIVQLTQSATAIPIKALPTTGANKVHPEFGIEVVGVELAAGKWIIPNKDGKCHPEIEAWISEMLFYDPRGHTGDRLIAAWKASEGNRLSTPKVEFGRLDLMSR